MIWPPRRRLWKHHLTLRGKLVLATVAAAAFLLAAVVLLYVALASAATPADQGVLRRLLLEQAALLLWGGVLVVVVLGFLIWRLMQRYVVHPRNLAASTRLIASANPSHRLPPGGAAELHQLAMAVNELANRYQAEQADVAARIAAARSDVEAERNRLAALMSELTVAVLVCSAEGRILLYNAAASSLLNLPGTAVHPVGLGRSVFGIVDRDLVAFALDRAARGEDPPGGYSATVAWGESLLRARVAMVAVPTGVARGAGAIGTEPASSGGFVVTLEDLTREAAAAERQDELVRALTTDWRASVANIRAAVETVLDYPDMPPEQQRRFLSIMQGEAAALTERMDDALATSPAQLDRRLAPADMLGRHLLEILARRLEDGGLHVSVEDPPRPLWLVVDGYAVVRAVSHLGHLLHVEHMRRAVQLRLGRSGRFARLDLCWAGPPIDSRTLDRWITTPMPTSGPGLAVSVADVLRHHGGEIWPGEDSHRVYLRMLLPLSDRPSTGPGTGPVPRTAARAAALEAEQVGRATPGDGADGHVPTVAAAYDFALLEPEGVAVGWDARPLDRLTYTVFDTETTGLFPAEGDEIISIGALRIVNRRLLRQETYEQLVDPHRTVPEASVRIHGIEPHMLRGMPGIDQVLPVFAGFAADTVLVGHNVAFDLQFLRAKEASSGVRFEQPVLDTLLLSAVVHPEHESHALDAIAERLGIAVIGRHTALGDAIVTGEVFLRLLDLLLEQGIGTLGEARAAARATAASRFSESLYTHARTP